MIYLKFRMRYSVRKKYRNTKCIVKRMETDRISTFSETKEGINMANKKSLESIYNEIEMLTAKIKSYNERLKKTGV